MKQKLVHLHDEKPCFCLADGMAHAAEDCDGVLVRPVVQDEPQEVRVAVQASWQGLCTGLPPSLPSSLCSITYHNVNAWSRQPSNLAFKVQPGHCRQTAKWHEGDSVYLRLYGHGKRKCEQSGGMLQSYTPASKKSPATKLVRSLMAASPSSSLQTSSARLITCKSIKVTFRAAGCWKTSSEALYPCLQAENLGHA